MNKKIKMIRPMRPSYIIVVGEKEENQNTVTVRNRDNRQVELKLSEAVDTMLKEIRQRLPSQTL